MRPHPRALRPPTGIRTSMLPRPRARLPLTAALALALAAYVARALVWRGGDFSVDLPGDAIAFGSFLVVVLLVAAARAHEAREGRRADVHDGHEDERRAG